MTIFDFISTKEQEQAALEEKLQQLEGRKALLDRHQQEYKLVTDSIKEVQSQWAYLQKEIDDFVQAHACKDEITEK